MSLFGSDCLRCGEQVTQGQFHVRGLYKRLCASMSLYEPYRRLIWGYPPSHKVTDSPGTVLAQAELQVCGGQPGDLQQVVLDGTPGPPSGLL